MSKISLSAAIDARNLGFTTSMKARLKDLSKFSDDALEWLVMEHYQFSFANKGLLQSAVETTEQLAESGVAEELRRNLSEEDGHAPMYKRGMMAAGTDMDKRVEFAPTTEFLQDVRKLTKGTPSAALGTLYATETAAIFEHEVFFDVCKEICRRRAAPWEGSLIKHFHDIHLSGGVEQGHKDGLAAFVDSHPEKASGVSGRPVDGTELKHGAMAAIAVMETWWTKLLDHAERI